jgi:hypothetical protein
VRYFIIAETVIRRLIIVIYGILLIPAALSLFPSNTGKESIKLLQQDGPVNKYEINKKMVFDGDVFTVKELYVSSKQVVLHYSIRKQVPEGWSFSQSALKLMTSNGEELMQHSSGSHISPWSENGYINYSYSGMKQPIASLSLTFDLYDRYASLQIPLVKDGER